MWDLLTDLWPMFVSLLHVTAAAGVTVHAVLRRRDVPAAIGWIGLAWLAPFLGSLLYLGFGINRIQRSGSRLQYPPVVLRPGAGDERGARASTHSLSSFESRPALRGLIHLGESVTGQALLMGTKVQPMINGDEAYPAMLSAIAGARRSIALATYIFDADRVGRQFLKALVAARARGVEVRVLIDDVGARYSRPRMHRLLADAGVPVATFLPTRTPRMFRYANLRNHRKLLVVDGAVGFTGGMNIREGHQLSLAPSSPVRCLHFQFDGPIVTDMMRVFAADWVFTTGEALNTEPWTCGAVGTGDVAARGIPDGPDADIENLPEILLGALAVARERIRIVTPYFLPDARILSALRVAALRGVTVDVVVPARSNVFLMDWATVPQLEDLLDAGCRIWRSSPPFDHTKLFVVDGIWSLVGSTNWDTRSLRLNFEYNVECYDAHLAAQLEALTEDRIVRAHRVDLEAIRQRSIVVQLRDGVARLLSPYL